MALRFRCLNCGNTTRFWVVWNGEVGILEDRYIDERSKDYPIQFGDPDDNESARLILTTPTLSLHPETALQSVACSDCEAPAEHLRWLIHGESKPVPLGELVENIYPYECEN